MTYEDNFQDGYASTETNMMSQVMCSLALKYLMCDANVDAVRLHQILINNDRHEGRVGSFQISIKFNFNVCCQKHKKWELIFLVKTGRPLGDQIIEQTKQKFLFCKKKRIIYYKSISISHANAKYLKSLTPSNGLGN